MREILTYEFVHNAIAAGILASLLCGLVGTFVVVKRLVFVSGGVSHAAFGGLGVFYFLGLPPLIGAAATALLAALALAGRSRTTGRSQDAVIGILWAVGMAVGVIFIARTPGFAPNLTTYLFGDILAVSKPLIAALAVFAGLVLCCVTIFFKELLAVSFDEEFARSRGLATRLFVVMLMVLIALSVVLLIQVVGAMLAIALLTIPPVISLSIAPSFRAVILGAVGIGWLMTMGGLLVSFSYDLPSGPAIVLLGFVMLLAVRLAQRLRTGNRRRATASIVAICVLSGAPTDANAEAPAVPTIGHLEFLGEANITTPELAGAPIGGLSGLTYDRASNLYYAVSDDRGDKGPARFYTLSIDLTQGTLPLDGVTVLAVTSLTTVGGQAFGAGRIDPEGIALTPAGTFIVASEGDARIELEPFLREFGADGVQRRDFPLGQRYAPRADGQSGVRYNLALESASLAPGGRFLFSATENALSQDGPESDLRHASPGRVLRYDLKRGRMDAEYLYWIDPVAEAPEPADRFSTAGVVEILALDEHRLITLERSFSFGRGNDIRLYEVDLTAATDIHAIDELARHGTDRVQPARKRLLLHINRLGIEPDNIEGMTLGPTLADGRPTLVLVSDDNFNRPNQKSQVLAFALGNGRPSIAEIQGRDHRSPLAGDWVRGVGGIVTAVDTDPVRGGFWIQESDDSADGDELTSDGLWIQAAPAIQVGDRVQVDGAIRETGAAGGLTLTTLDAAVLEKLDSAQPLPAPLLLGRQGRRPPAVIIDDDRLSSFDPCCDAIDFFESIEGMRVEIHQATAVSGATRFGEIVVLGDDGEGADSRSSRGGIVLRPGDSNPERIVLDDRLSSNATPDVAVGEIFTAPLRGVVDYAFGNFRVQVETWPPTAAGERSLPQPRPDKEGEVSIATYNVLNLDALDGESQFRRIADSIVGGLGSPAILGLQEIQDDNGAADDGVVSAQRTLELLVDAIVRAGGPRYAFRQIDPQHNADGGQPNGNIRVAWLFDTRRANPVDRGTTLATEGNVSPMRIATDSPAFAGDPERNWRGGRKCLAVEAIVKEKDLLLVNCHLKSKRGDDRLFGAVQPPVFHTEEQRSAQVRELRAFVSQRLEIDPESRIVVLGDMNEHEFRPPMQLLASPPLVNLMTRIGASERYTFNFNGNSQLLDHILVSPSLAGRVTDVAIAHLNTDAAATERASDHDPVLVRLRLD